MRFHETPLPGAYVLEPERVEDARGFFARTWAPEELEARGLDASIAYAAISFNARRGTLRGMHFQASPHEETKVVRCTSGAVFDVIVDLREGSTMRHRSFAVELSAANRLALYVPKGFAHGFQTLEDASEVHYLISTPWVADSGRVLHHASAAYSIRWPLPVSVISERDAAAPHA